MNTITQDFQPVDQATYNRYTFRSNSGIANTIGHPHDQCFITKLKTPRLLTKSLLRVYQTEFEGLGKEKQTLIT